MAHGLEIYDAAGALVMGVTNRVTRLIYTRALPAAESSSATVTDFDAATCVAFAVPRLTATPLAVSPQRGHTISTSGTTITWTAADPSAAVRRDCDLFVFAYE